MGEPRGELPVALARVVIGIARRRGGYAGEQPGSDIEAVVEARYLIEYSRWTRDAFGRNYSASATAIMDVVEQWPHVPADPPRPTLEQRVSELEAVVRRHLIRELVSVLESCKET